MFKNNVDYLNFILSVLLVADVCQCNGKIWFAVLFCTNEKSESRDFSSVGQKS